MCQSDFGKGCSTCCDIVRNLCVFVVYYLFALVGWDLDSSWSSPSHSKWVWLSIKTQLSHQPSSILQHNHTLKCTPQNRCVFFRFKCLPGVCRYVCLFSSRNHTPCKKSARFFVRIQDGIKMRIRWHWQNVCCCDHFYGEGGWEGTSHPCYQRDCAYITFNLMTLHIYIPYTLKISPGI